MTPTTAHIQNDTLTAGRLAEECLWEAQAENLSAAEVDRRSWRQPPDLYDLRVEPRGAEQKIDEEGE
jgi:hypothetical protein